ncbi:MAG: hypothetical protein JWM12_3191 [Ilumatobacteraceae bacterium]|nr:hypothetical protein [Ilumatobacteraceae bacterium]
MRDGSVVDLVAAGSVARDPMPRLCLVAPGRHSPVLGTMTEHVISALSRDWLVSTVQVAIPNDPFDSTLIGLNTPSLVRVPSLVDSSAQSWLTRRRRLHRFFVRERPDVVMVDLWSLRQVEWLATVVRAAEAADARVVVRCCGRLDHSLSVVERTMLRWVLQRIDLLVTQGHMPPGFAGAGCPVLALPEWKTEERQMDPQAVEVLAFLPSQRCDEAELLLRAFDGLSDQRANEFSVVLVQRAGSQTAELERLVRSTHHASRIHLMSEWLSDTQLERRVARTDVIVLFEPSARSRGLDTASHHGIPVVVIRDTDTGPGDDYSGATVCPRDPASVLASIDRANLARRFRYPQREDFVVGARLLSQRLFALASGDASMS